MKIVADTLLDDLTSSLHIFKNYIKKTEVTARKIEYIEDLLHVKKLVNSFGNSDAKHIFQAILSDQAASKALNKLVEDILKTESLLLERSQILPCLSKDYTQDFCVTFVTFEKDYSEFIQNYKQMLRKYCPPFDSVLHNMSTDLSIISDDIVLFITSVDISLFSNISEIIDQQKPNIKTKISEGIAIIWKEFLKKLNNLSANTLNINMSRLTNSVYLYIFKSFLEYVNKKQSLINILKINVDGNIIIKKDDALSENDYLQYRFIGSLLNHFNPLHLLKSNSNFEYNFIVIEPEKQVLELPQERLVWIYILDNSLAVNLDESEYADVLGSLNGVINIFIQLIKTHKSDSYELFRIFTNNIILFILSVSQYFLKNKNDSSGNTSVTADEEILQSQIDIINSSHEIESDVLAEVLASLIAVCNDYWQQRETVIKNIYNKFPYEPFKEKLDDISSKLLAISALIFKLKTETTAMVTCCRAFNEFLKLLHAIDFSWLIKESVTLDGKDDSLELINSDKNIYKVINIVSYIDNFGKLNTPKHYVIEVVHFMLSIIEEFLLKDSLNEVKVKAVGDLLLSTGRSFIHLKRQEKYTDFKQFYSDITKPFSSVITCDNYADFKQRVDNIENFFLYTQRENEINIDKALELFTTETQFIQQDEFDNTLNIQKLKLCYRKYIHEFDRCISTKENGIIQNLKQGVERYKKQDINKLNNKFKENKVPFLLAHLSALWSKLHSEDISSTGKIMKPHCIQILCIMRLLNVDNDKPGIDNHLAQVLTGQGKSLILGLLASLLAVLGHDVRIVCYSEYLAKRDHADFEKYFNMLSGFNVCSKIKYGTFKEMANEVLEFKINGQPSTLRTIVSQLITNKLEKQSSSIECEVVDNTVLLIDEVDVFFSEEFYGSLYCPVTSIIFPAVGEIQLKIWQLVNSEMEEGLILQKIREFTDSIVKAETDPAFNKLVATSNDFIIEHLKEMVADAFVVKADQTNKDRFKIDTDGYITYREDNGLYIKTTFLRYQNVFHYLRLKKNNFEIKWFNYSYLQVQCGAISYAMLPNEYPLILGVSGTLTTLNTPELQAVKSYNINQISSMSTFFGLHKLNFNPDCDFTLVDTEDDWLIKIFNKISKELRDGRAVIVFFDSEQELNIFKDKYEGNINRLNIVTGNEEKNHLEWCISEAGVAQTVTLATKNMGRGVDYKSNDSGVEKKGGVHVLQTFFSLDVKEETQIKGRTARKDNRGSYEMVICIQHLEDFQGLTTYSQFSDTRKILAEQKRSNDNYRIKLSAEKHKKTLDFMKSFSNYTPEKRQSYLKEYPVSDI